MSEAILQASGLSKVFRGGGLEVPVQKISPRTF